MSSITERDLINTDLDQPVRRTPIDRGKIVSYLILLVFALLYIGPMFLLVNTSFKTLPEFFKDATGLAPSINFDNFVEAWEKANFPTYLFNSALYTVTATTIFVSDLDICGFSNCPGIRPWQQNLAYSVRCRPVSTPCSDPPIPTDFEPGTL